MRAFFPLFLMLALLLSAGAPPSAETEGKEWRALCRAALEGTPAERASAVRRLRPWLDRKAVRKTFERVLEREKDRAVLLDAVETLCTPAAAGLFDAVSAHLYHPDLDVRRQVSYTLAAQDRAKALKLLRKRARAGGRRGCEALRALGRIIRPGEAKAVSAFLSHPEAAMRATAAATLMRTGAVDRAADVLPLLSDRDFLPRAQAIQAAAFFRMKEAVPALVKLLDDAECSALAHDALVELCGTDLGGKSAAWRAWLKGKPAFEPPPFERLGAAGEVRFFDHRVKVRRFAWMLDFSDSMGSGTGSSLEALLREVRACLFRLPPNVEFNCVAYSRAADAFVPVAAEADFAAKAEFLEWLSARGTDAYTATWDGLKLALSVPELEVLFLAGNGLPNHGELPAGKNAETEDNVLDAVLKTIRERALRVKIYTVAFPFEKDLFEAGADPLRRKEDVTARTFERRAESFFRLLAALTGGKYAFVPVSQRRTGAGKKGR